jgi:hypothetical protein
MMLSIILNSESLPYDQSVYWIANACGLSFYISAAILLLLIASGQITFASENRSTSIRAVLMAPSILLVGWMVYFFLDEHQDDALYVMATLAGIYWALAGALLSGETAQLSPRAMRQLPQSLLGRMAFTWFNPGSGTGYVFTMINLLAAMLTGAVVVFFGDDNTLLARDATKWTCYAVSIVGYVAAYLGFTRLLVVALRRFTNVGMLASFLCHIIIATLGILGPLLLQAVVNWGNYNSFEYTLLQLPNWSWTLYEMLERTNFGGVELATFVGCVGAGIFLINLVVAAREVEYVRLQAPQRVIEDDRQRQPPPKPVKTSPWDTQPASSSAPS